MSIDILVSPIVTDGDENQLSTGTSYPPQRTSHRISNLGQGRLLYFIQNVGHSYLVCKFIFRFPYVEPFGHDDSPNEGTVALFGTILGIFPSPPK